MKVIDFLKLDAIIAELAATTKADTLSELANHMARLDPKVDARELRRVLEERELLASTAIGDGIAIPHGKLDSIGELAGVLARSGPGIEFDSIDGRPTHLIFMLVAPLSSTGVHLKALARLSRLFRDADFRRRLLAAPTREDMYRVIADEDAKY
ncbi:MAG TPA: PTS sugar transporter subunit IIA [Polyangia bacterium]|jgi:PTS system nitrogen regulatory IIA component|nr:PTS sugar transporter subunit IIA [Polyangia bacterium]